MRTFQLAHEGGSVIPGGPFADEDVRRLWEEGQLDRSTLYWSESAQNWKPLATLFPVEILFEEEEEIAVASPIADPLPLPQTQPRPPTAIRITGDGYHRPLLSSAFIVLACLIILGGALFSGFALAGANNDPKAIAAVLATLLWPVGSCLFSALVLLGFAQVINYLGKTAFHAERVANALTNQ
jgi:hypothetical protein